MWHMPLDDEYRDQLKTVYADIQNIGGRWGGACSAAMFLKEFVGDTPWIHVDMAGTALARRCEAVDGQRTHGSPAGGVREPRDELEVISRRTSRTRALPSNRPGAAPCIQCDRSA